MNRARCNSRDSESYVAVIYPHQSPQSRSIVLCPVSEPRFDARPSKFGRSYASFGLPLCQCVASMTSPIQSLARFARFEWILRHLFWNFNISVALLIFYLLWNKKTNKTLFYLISPVARVLRSCFNFWDCGLFQRQLFLIFWELKENVKKINFHIFDDFLK